MVTLYEQALRSFRAGQTAEARTILEQLSASGAADPEAINLLASCYFRMGDYRWTEHLLRQILARNPHNARYCYNLAFALERQGRTSEAIDGYKNAVRLQPDFPEARERLAALQATENGKPSQQRTPSRSFRHRKTSQRTRRPLKIITIAVIIVVASSLLVVAIGGISVIFNLDLPGWADWSDCADWPDWLQKIFCP